MLPELGIFGGRGGLGGVSGEGFEGVFRFSELVEVLRLSGDATPFSKKGEEGGVLAGPGEGSPRVSVSRERVSVLPVDTFDGLCFLGLKVPNAPEDDSGGFRLNLNCLGWNI